MIHLKFTSKYQNIYKSTKSEQIETSSYAFNIL